METLQAALRIYSNTYNRVVRKRSPFGLRFLFPFKKSILDKINGLFMNILLKLEESALLLLGTWAFYLTGLSWWWFAGLFFLPDLGMAGYLAGKKVGAWLYNFFHHRTIALIIFGLGFWIENQKLEVAGIILFSHIAFDRTLGFGLKYEKGFKFTHLGEIGKK
ncbi:MAG: DUF4260 domain-containing protein [Algoriphagus sp.]|nr:DUF4260 domain-containing protein [Algoriphagus sp.]